MNFEAFTGAVESFVGVNWFTMLAAWCNLIILFLFLKHLLFKPLKNMIDSRQKEIDDMYSDAESQKAMAEKMKGEYEEKLSSANERSEEILKDAHRRALLREEEILRDAEAKAKRTLERAEEEIELEKKKAVNDVKDELSEMAIGIASAVIERDVSADEHRELIDEFIEKMGSGS